MDPNEIIDYILEKDMIHDLLTKMKAKLYITTPEYAYMKIGPISYYFHGDVKKREIETMGNGKKIQSIIPYDGFEVSMPCNCGEKHCLEDNQTE